MKLKIIINRNKNEKKTPIINKDASYESDYSSDDESSLIVDDELSPEMTLIIFNKFTFQSALKNAAKKHFLNNLKYLSWEDLENIANRKVSLFH